MEQFLIRGAKEADRVEIARMIARVFRQDYGGTERDPEKIAMAVASAIDPSRFFVALQNGKYAGIAACSDAAGRAMRIHSPETLAARGLLRKNGGYIEFVGVAEQYRRRGAATSLLRCILGESGYAEYILDVDADNAPAIDCYRKLGFRAFGRVPASARAPERISMRYAARAAGEGQEPPGTLCNETASARVT